MVLEYNTIIYYHIVNKGEVHTVYRVKQMTLKQKLLQKMKDHKHLMNYYQAEYQQAVQSNNTSKMDEYSWWYNYHVEKRNKLGNLISDLYDMEMISLRTYQDLNDYLWYN